MDIDPTSKMDEEMSEYLNKVSSVAFCCVHMGARAITHAARRPSSGRENSGRFRSP